MRTVSLFLLMLLATTVITAQSVSNYVFSHRSNGSLYELTTNATVLFGAGTNDYAADTMAIGFPFVFMGNRVSSFSCSPDGAIAFDFALRHIHVQFAMLNRNMLLVNNTDSWLNGTRGQVRTEVFGVAPNRIRVVEWRNVHLSRDNSRGIPSSFQAALHEGSGVIEYLYGNMFFNGSAQANNSIGFSSSNSVGTVGSVLGFNTSSTPTWNTGSASFSQVPLDPSAAILGLSSGENGARRVFTFTPTAVTNLTASSQPITNINASGMQLNWNDATGEVLYEIQRSTDNVNFTVAATLPANTSQFIATNLMASTMYYWRVVARTEGTEIVLPSTNYRATTLAPSVSGSITVPGTYPTLTAAINDIVQKGVSGPTTINLTTGFSSNNEPAFPIVIPGINGTSATNTITIRPAVSGISLQTSSTAGPTIDLNGAKHVIIDGRVNGTGAANMIIQNLGRQHAGIRFQNDACFNTIRHVQIRAQSTTVAGCGIFFGATQNLANNRGNDNNTIEFNTFGSNSSAHTWIHGLGVNSPNLANSGNVIASNSFTNFVLDTASITSAIFLERGNTDITITGNSFFQTTNITYTVPGAAVNVIRVDNTADGSFTITNNFIGGTAANADGNTWVQEATVRHTFIGISVNAAASLTPSNISGNVIRRITSTISSAGSFQCISVTNGSANVGGTIGNEIGGPSAAGITINALSSGTTTILIRTVGTGVVNVSNNRLLGITVSAASTNNSSNLRCIQINSTNVSSSIQIINGNTLGTSAAPLVNNTRAALVGIETLNTNTNYEITNNVLQHFVSSNAASTATIAGIQVRGTSALISRNIVRLFTFTGANTAGFIRGIVIESASVRNFSVVSNTIHSFNQTQTDAAARMQGIRIESTTTRIDGVISKNFIHSFGSAGTVTTNTFCHGISIDGGVVEVSNNKIRLGINSAGQAVTNPLPFYGIFSGNNTTRPVSTKIFHNSVFIGGSGVLGAVNTAAYFRSGSGVDTLRNNIFVNNRSNTTGATGRHFGIHAANTNNYNAAGNILFGNGTGFILATADNNTTTITTLAGYQSAFATDGSAVLVNPNFSNATGDTSAVNLRVASTSAVESAGLRIASVTDDFDGNARNATTGLVDVGADEGSFTVTDNAAPNITSSVSSVVWGSTGTTIIATISDVTGVPTTGTLVPRLYFRRNTPTTSTFHSVAGVLQSGNGINGIWRFDINYSVLSGGISDNSQIQYYIAAQDTRTTPNMTTFPTGASGMTNVNTITTPPSTFVSYNIQLVNDWVGTTNTNWFTATNWSRGVTPMSFDVVRISNLVSNMPAIPTGSVANIRALIVDTGRITIDGGSLTVATVAAARGSIIVNSGNFTVRGGADSGIQLLSPNSALIINGGTVRIGSGTNDVHNRLFEASNNSLLSVTGGTFIVEGGMHFDHARFTQTGGSIVIDPQGANGSLNTGVNAFDVLNSNLSLSSGSIVFPDGVGNSQVFRVSNTQPIICTGDHTVIFGDVSSMANVNFTGLYQVQVNDLQGIPSFHFRNMLISNRGPQTSNGRSFVVNYSPISVTNRLEIMERGTLSTPSPLYAGGNIINNGTIDRMSIKFENVVSGTAMPVTTEQVVSGTGKFMLNDVSFEPIPGFYFIHVNNNSEQGVRFTQPEPFLGRPYGNDHVIHIKTGKLSIPSLSLSSTNKDSLIFLEQEQAQLNLQQLSTDVSDDGSPLTIIGRGKVNVFNTLELNDGILNLENPGILVLKATDSSTARLTYVKGAIIGDIAAEVYARGGSSQPNAAVPAARGFRFIGNPFLDSITVSQLITNGSLDVTGPGGATNGFTNNPNPNATNNPSAFRYNGSIPGAGATQVDPGWIPFTRANGLADGANHNRWVGGEGIRVLFRGTPGQGLNYDAANPATHYTVNPSIVKLLGVPNLGDFVSTLAAPHSATIKHWTLVANPYLSSINIGTALNRKFANGTGGIGATAYVYNPNKLNTTRGGYDAIDISQNTAYILPTMGVVVVENIATGSNAIHFVESDKSDATSNLGFRNQAVVNQIGLELTDSMGVNIDEHYVRFNSRATDSIDAFDGSKMLNEFSVYGLVANQRFYLHSLPSPTAPTTLPIGIYAARSKQMLLVTTQLNLPTGMQAVLKDKWLQQEQLLQSGTQYNFAVTADSASQGNHRFEIVLRPAATLPVSFQRVNAQWVGNRVANITWSVGVEQNIHSYEVERSANGSQFAAIGTVVANNQNRYELIDAQALEGTNYYRIKVRSQGGDTKYSQVVLLRSGKAASGIQLLPNVIPQGTEAVVQLQSLAAGQYQLQLVSKNGQVVHSRNYVHAGGNASIVLPTQSLVSGGYQVIVSNQQTKYVEQMLVQ